MQGKVCPECGEFKPYTDFHKNRSRPDGHARICKVPCKKFYDDRYLETNREKAQASSRAWKEKNRDQQQQYQVEWRKENRALANAHNAAYRAAKIRAIPCWFNNAEVNKVYAQCRILNRKSTETYQVDHIVPLQGEYVSGLHCHHNLQLLPASENAAKGNSHDCWEFVHELPESCSPNSG